MMLCGMQNIFSPENLFPTCNYFYVLFKFCILQAWDKKNQNYCDIRLELDYKLRRETTIFETVVRLDLLNRSVEDFCSPFFYPTAR